MPKINHSISKLVALAFILNTIYSLEENRIQSIKQILAAYSNIKTDAVQIRLQPEWSKQTEFSTKATLLLLREAETDLKKQSNPEPLTYNGFRITRSPGPSKSCRFYPWLTIAEKGNFRLYLELYVKKPSQTGCTEKNREIQLCSRAECEKAGSDLIRKIIDQLPD